MIRILSKMSLSALLVVSLTLQACSTTWISKLDTIIAVAAPSLLNVLNIVAIAEGKPVDAALEAKITADAANLKVVAAQLAAASAAAAPTACAQTQAAVQVINDDAQLILQIVQVSSASSTTNALVVFQAADAIIITITALIPSCATPVATRELARARLTTLDTNKLISDYNFVLTRPTGYPNVDNFNRTHQLHAHNKFVRVITLGHAK
jgi:hypothetical protein